jgi:hypothetical protein
MFEIHFSPSEKPVISLLSGKVHKARAMPSKYSVFGFTEALIGINYSKVGIILASEWCLISNTHHLMLVIS